MSEVFNPASYFLNPYAIPTTLVSTLIFATGLFVFLQNKKSATNISFFLFCLSLNLWLYGSSLLYCSKDPQVGLILYRWVVFLGVAHISPLVYTFTVHWLGLHEKQKFWVWLSFIVAPIFYVLAVATPYGMPRIQTFFWGFYPAYGMAGKIFLLFFFGYFLAGFYNFFSELKKQSDPLKHKQIKLVAIAFLISITGSVDYLPKLVPIPLYPFGYLSVLVWVFIVAYLIVRYRVMDIQTVIHKTIMWGLSSFIFAAPIIFFAYLGKDWLSSLSPITFSSIVFCLMVLFVAYSRLIQPKIDHLFQRRRWDLARVFEKFTEELVHLRELEDLSRHIIETIRDVFYVEQISLLLSRDENSAFEPVKSFFENKKVSFDRVKPFLIWLETNDKVVLREYVDLDPQYESVKESANEYFRATDVQVCVPLSVNKQLLGVINIGQKANLKRFDPDEINFLSDLRRAAAIALSNSLRSIAMQESLRRWNIELEKKVEERTKELKDTQAQLIQAEKLASIGTLAGGIAHEINNPLTAVLTNVQMLKLLEQVEDTESLSLIEEGAKRCQQIIQKLMRYARKTDEVQTLDQVDVNRSIQVTCDFLGYQMKQEDIELELLLKPVGMIAAIANELEQVFTNLILNSKDAIRAADRKGKIGIETGQKDGWVFIKVSDNGVGIKKENLVRVFDPFYTTKDVGEGTGLGLTVSTGIIEKFRGKISVESEEEKGTTFSIQFPVCHA